MRVIVRSEPIHPKYRELKSYEKKTDFRYQAIATNTPGQQLQFLDARARSHTRVEAGIRRGKALSLNLMPSKYFAINQAWCTLLALAVDLARWLQLLATTGQLARAEPGSLRAQLLDVPAKLADHARRRELKLDPTWPASARVVEAWDAVQALPDPADPHTSRPRTRKPFIARSRCRVGWWEFSARLFKALVRAVLHRGHHRAVGGAVTAELVGDDHPRHRPGPLQRFPEEAPGCGLVAPVLQQDVEHVPVLVDSPPQVLLHPVDLDEDLVEMPFVARPRAASAQGRGVGGTEPARPLVDRFVADLDAALEHQLLDIAQAQAEPVVQPHTMAPAGSGNPGTTPCPRAAPPATPTRG